MKFVLGLAAGFIFALLGQYCLEVGYVRDGIAKINGRYFHITPFKNSDSEDDSNV